MINDELRMTDCHPERSEAKSKDPVKLLFGFAAGFLDFARNDAGLICPSSFGIPSSPGIRVCSLRFENLNERFLRDVLRGFFVFSYSFLLLFPFFLLLKYFSFGGDIPAVAFRFNFFS